MGETEMLLRASGGDADAFDAAIAPHRRELLVHCYRMLGSLQDAEDVLQETMLAAWQGLAGFESRSSLRTWLYRIATNRCLNARRAARRRPAEQWNVPGVQPPEPTRLGEVVWLEPMPDDPSAAFFEHIVTDLGLESEQLLFLDDQPANVAGARSAGLDAECWAHNDGITRLYDILDAHGIPLDRGRKAACR